MMIEIFFIIIVVLIIIYLSVKLSETQDKLNKTQYSKQSQSVKYGQLSEQWMPFLKSYPYDSHEFKFLGKPIDGIQFNEDSIVFVEFKANTSQLSPTQKHIKKLIEEGKVRFEEIRLN